MVEKGMEDYQVTAVTADLSKVLISADLARPTALGSIWDRSTKGHLAVISPVFADGKVRFFAERDSISEWTRHLSELSVDGFVSSYDINENLVPLSVIGDRFSQDGAALQEVIEKLAQSHISVTMGAASSLAITVAVARTRADDGVRALHQSFFEKDR